MTFNLALLVMAALLFTCGGVSMKYSVGLTRLLPSILTGILFLAGAGCQALAMRREDMSVAYIFVLGLESVLAFIFGRIFFGESVSVSRIAAVILIILGVVLLRRQSVRPARRSRFIVDAVRRNADQPQLKGGSAAPPNFV